MKFMLKINTCNGNFIGVRNTKIFKECFSLAAAFHICRDTKIAQIKHTNILVTFSMLFEMEKSVHLVISLFRTTADVEIIKKFNHVT